MISSTAETQQQLQARVQLYHDKTFRKAFDKLLQQPAVVSELQRRSIDNDNLGSHSVRKGASTFTASGSTAFKTHT